MPREDRMGRKDFMHIDAEIISLIFNILNISEVFKKCGFYGARKTSSSALAPFLRLYSFVNNPSNPITIKIRAYEPCVPYCICYKLLYSNYASDKLFPV